MDPAACFRVPPALHVDALLLGDDGVTIRAVSEASEARCPVLRRTDEPRPQPLRAHAR